MSVRIRRTTRTADGSHFVRFGLWRLFVSMVKRWCCLAGVALVLVGCRMSTIGTSAFEVMPSGPTLLSAPRQVEAEPAADIYINYISVRPRRELAKPEYPAEALAGGAGGYTLYVIIRIDEEGRVTDVGPSLMQPYLPHPFAEAFLAAVRSAVATWELEPARQVYWQRVAGGDDQYLRTEAIAERLEFRFSFTMADVP